MSTKMKAIKVIEAGKAEIQDVEVPELERDYLLIKISHVALNPTDWKHIDYIPYPGATVGCDFAGTISAIGPDCSSQWQVGTRVAGVTQGCDYFNHSAGSFGEFASVREGGVYVVPDGVKDEDAATTGVAFVTVGLGVYQTLGLPWPGSVAFGGWVLVYGGSSATGSVAIQFAKLSGAKVITTCSPKNFDFVKSLGAEEAFDYNDAECAAKIRKHTNDSLFTAFDCIGGETGVAITSSSISSKGGQICSIIPTDTCPREDVRFTVILAYRVRGESWHLFQDYPATMEDYEFGRVFLRLAVKMLAEGKVKVHPPRVGEGLEGVLEGLDEMRNGKVSGQKLVYKI